MAKQRENDDTTKSAAGESPSLPWGAQKRAIVSIFLAFHVAAVFIAPWSGPPPSSGLSQWVSGAIRPYLEGLGINYGYRFFAPTPGPSHIVRYRLQLRDGSIKEGQFPDLEEQWPRLLYHRHLMVAERVHTFLQDPPIPPQEIPGFARMPPQQQQQLLAEYQTQGRIYNETREPLMKLTEPIAQRLMIEHDADAVDLLSVEHRIPFPRDIIDGRPIDDPQYYVERFVGSFRRQ